MTAILPDAIATLILEEQARQSGQFIEDVDLPVYLAKLADRAEWLSDFTAGRCRGFVAYYCNDPGSRRAFITLVLVDPRDRGTGLGRALVTCVLQIAKQRGFTACGLEVAKSNQAAHDLYLSLGFQVVEERGHRVLLEANL